MLRRRCVCYTPNGGVAVVAQGRHEAKPTPTHASFKRLFLSHQRKDLFHYVDAMILAFGSTR